MNVPVSVYRLMGHFQIFAITVKKHYKHSSAFFVLFCYEIYEHRIVYDLPFYPFNVCGVSGYALSIIPNIGNLCLFSWLA